MYLDHFHLDTMPFNISPDPRFLWFGPEHKKAYTKLRYGIRETKGFVIITGDPGSGKSTLLNAIIAGFEDDVSYAKISDPAIDEMDFFKMIADALKMNRDFLNKADFVIQFKELIKSGQRRIVLLVDEAQRLTPGMLEQLRLFSNEEEPGQEVLSCIFSGQPGFFDMARENKALSQRVFFIHAIQPLKQSEVEQFIAHRLMTAGRQEPVFTQAAVEEIFRLSQGNPRLINLICDQSLVRSYAAGETMIGPDTIRKSEQITFPPTPSPILALSEPANASSAAQMDLDRAPASPGIRFESQSRFWKANKVRTLAAAVVIGLGFFGLGYWFAGASTNNADQFENPEIAELRRQKDEAAAHLKELRARLAELESELTKPSIANETNPADRLAAELHDRTTSVEKLRQELEMAKSLQSKLKADIQEVRQHNAQLRSQLLNSRMQPGLPNAPAFPARVKNSAPQASDLPDTPADAPDKGSARP